ncbi:MAG: hypothetical protein L0271_23800 [Gemmatimonadetes bacterium]|nr:hypothetical protein [Gemmatimonadota bacterium]
MQETREITQYAYYLWSSRPDNLVQANIAMYGSAGFMGALWFYHESHPLPDPTRHSAGVYSLHYPMSAFGPIVDMLRNEKPVFVHWNDSFPVNTRISTSPEPVGEGEA